MIYCLSGNDHAGLSQRLRFLSQEFSEQYGELAIERIDGEEASAAVVAAAVRSLPFLTEKKLVIVRNLSSNKAAAEEIEQIIDSVSASTDLIFLETSPDKRTAFYKFLKNKTNFESFENKDVRDLPSWVVAQTESYGASIKLADANYLINRVGANQQILASELEKLATYGPAIDRQGIDLLTEETPQGKVFDLLEAIFSGNKARALDLYEQQRRQRVEPQEIMAMLAWQLRLMSLAKLAGNRSPDQIAKDVGGSPFPISKAANLTKKLDKKSLTTMVIEAEKIDKLSKSTAIDLDEAMRTYIATIIT